MYYSTCFNLRIQAGEIRLKYNGNNPSKLGEIGIPSNISTLFHEAKRSLFPLYFFKDISTLFHEAKRSLFPLYFFKDISTLFHEAKLSLFPLYFFKSISTLFHEAKRSLFPLYFFKDISTLFHEAKLSLFPLYFFKSISTLFHEAKRSLFQLYFNYIPLPSQEIWSSLHLLICTRSQCPLFLALHLGYRFPKPTLLCQKTLSL